MHLCLWSVHRQSFSRRASQTKMLLWYTEYGTMFCLDALKDSGPIAYQCDTMGNNLNQQYFFQATGLIRHSSGFCLGATSDTQLTKVNCSSPLATKWEQVGGYE